MIPASRSSFDASGIPQRVIAASRASRVARSVGASRSVFRSCVRLRYSMPLARLSSEQPPGPSNYMQLLVACASMTGLVIFDCESRYPEGLAQLASWRRSGELRSHEDIVPGGVAAFPETLLRLVPRREHRQARARARRRIRRHRPDRGLMRITVELEMQNLSRGEPRPRSGSVDRLGSQRHPGGAVGVDAVKGLGLE
jgi:hypothetical protein